MKKRLYDAGIIICICLMAFSGYKIYDNFAKDKQYTDEFDSIAQLVDHAATSDDANEASEANKANEAALPDYNAPFLKNNDMVGWIKIEGTSVDYPVMQTPDDPDYYLKRNFERQYSDYGVPYADSQCDVFSPSDNIIIYGHHIKNGNMFGALEDYKNQSFYEKHKIIRFDTLTGLGEYMILAVFQTVLYTDDGFAYYDFVDSDGESEFNAYVSKCKELSLYETNVTAEYGDKLLTLSTCEYFAENGRLVVVAKKIEN